MKAVTDLIGLHTGKKPILVKAATDFIGLEHYKRKKLRVLEPSWQNKIENG